MSAKNEVAGSRFDWLKWFLAIGLVVAAGVGNSIFSDQAVLYRYIGVIVVALMAVGIAAQTAKGRQFIELLKEARNEMRRIVVPTRQETLQTTLLVVVIVALTALILWALDLFLGWVIFQLIG